MLRGDFYEKMLKQINLNINNVIFQIFKFKRNMFAEMEILNIFSVNQNKPTIECPNICNLQLH